jgi:hypothetical protein
MMVRGLFGWQQRRFANQLFLCQSSLRAQLAFWPITI